MSAPKPRNTVSVEVTVGIFVAIVFAALCLFTIVISGTTLFTKDAMQIKVVLPDAMGLRRNDPVIARGTAVGVVDQVYYAQNGVHVVAKLNAPVVFYEGYKITVVQTSILGGRQLSILEGPPNAPRVTDTSSLVGEVPVNLMEDVALVVNRLRDFSESEFFDNLKKASVNLTEISDRLNRGEGTLGKLLSSDSTLYDNLNGTISDAREYLDDIREITPVSTFMSFIFGAF